MMRRLRRDRRGNVFIIAGAGAIALIGASGVAIDATRTWMVRSRMVTALDAAAIAAARIYTPGTSDALTQPTLQACAVFWANFGASSTTNPCTQTNGQFQPNGEARGFMGAYSGNPAIVVGANNTLTLTVNARLASTLSRVVGFRDQIATIASSAAIRTVSSLEIALALDVTASMYPDNKFQALRTAATNFINAIYGNQETREATYVSITPYTTHVNIGTAAYAQAMVTADSRAQFNGLYDSRNQAVPWQGCIEARYRRIGGSSGPPGDLTDDPPSTADSNTMFRAWFYPSTLNGASPPQSQYSRTVSGATYYYPGDNDWRSYVLNNAAVNNRAINEWALNQNTTRPGAPQGGAAQDPRDIVGPHLGCLYEPRYVVLPLTAGRTTLVNRIAGLEAEPWQWHRYMTGQKSITHGGTVIHAGLQMAWLTISPRWTGLWGLPRTANNRTLPLTADVAGQKVIVLMTDGNNEFYPNARTWLSENSSGRPDRGAPAGCTEYSPANPARSPRHPLICNPPDSRDNPVYRTATDTGYGPYGRLSSGGLFNLGTNRVVNVTNSGTNGDDIQDDAVAALNDRLSRLCTTIRNSGVHIYTVGFTISSGSQADTLLRNCANTPSDYFLASNAATLNAAFQEIANRVGRVRLVR
ncbi:MAG TPA: pilus assembly protein TadG-related protein [Roseomonas sp.]|jgi:Flp pilus assembly protein TadG